MPQAVLPPTNKVFDLFMTPLRHLFVNFMVAFVQTVNENRTTVEGGVAICQRAKMELHYPDLLHFDCPLEREAISKSLVFLSRSCWKVSKTFQLVKVQHSCSVYYLELKLMNSCSCLLHSEEECAKAFALFNARWYASKQLSCEFSPVTKWKSAICGTCTNVSS